MPDVFISYRRTDKDFVAKLDEALRARGKDVWVDWEDIPPGSADFTQDLLRGIESSDALLSVLSPEYLVSEYCLGELQYAYENNKKLVPVVYRDVPDEALPESIRHVNQIFFNREDDFETALQKVIDALENDWAYRQEHTRLVIRAHEWERADYDDSFLLRGTDLAQAETWLVQSAHKTPGATDLQTEYIIASRHASVRRQRVTVGSLIVGLIISLLLAAVALVGFQQAEQNLDRALSTQALFLADLSRQQLDTEQYRVGLLLALESLANFPRVFNSESSRALLNALNNPPQRLLSLSHDDPINSLRWDASIQQVLVTTGDFAYLADLSGGQETLMLQHGGAARGAIWNAARTQLLTWSEDGTARVWDPLIATELFALRHLGPVRGAAWDADESRIVTWSADGSVRLWNATDGSPLNVFIQEMAVNGILWNQDQTGLLIWTAEGLAFLRDAANGDVLATYSHTSPIRGAAWANDESRILMWSADGSVYIWSVDGRIAVTLPAAHDTQGAAWSPDYNRVITWGLDGTVKLWSADDGILLLTLTHDRAVNGVVWSRDGSRIMSWSQDSTVGIWSAADGQRLLTLTHGGTVNGAGWNADETRILTWSNDGTARVWDMNGAEIQNLPHTSPVDRALWDDAHNQILTSTISARLHLWTTITNTFEPQQPVADLNTGERAAGIAWNRERTRFLTWADNGRVDMWNATTGQRLLTVQHTGAAVGAAWSADESRFLAWSVDNTVRVWDAASGASIASYIRNGAALRGAGWNADETHIQAWGNDGVVQVWDVETGSSVTLRHTGTVRGAAWDAAGQRILTWTNNDLVQIWNVTSGEVVFDLPHDRGRLSFNVQGAAWNSDGSQVLSWAQDGVARLWHIPADDTADPQPGFTLLHSTVVRNAAWSPDERYILTWTGRGDDFLRVWDASEGVLFAALPHGVSSFGIAGAVWSADSQRILSWSSNGLVRVWDLNDINGGSFQPLTLRHSRNVLGATWNNDESRILTWPSDNTALVWDAKTGQELLLLVNNDVVQSAGWNADEKRIISRIRGGLVRLWIVDVEELIQIGQGRIIEGLTAAERQRFFLPVLN